MQANHPSGQVANGRVASGQVEGFTLVELLVAITIFAVIASIAVPIYTEYSQRGYRAEIQADMLTCAQAMERFSAANFTYVGVVDTDSDGISNPGGTNGPLGTDICDPIGVDQGRYTLNAVVTATTFDLTAEPQTGAMADDGHLTLDESGNREWDENDDNAIGQYESDWVDDEEV